MIDRRRRRHFRHFHSDTLEACWAAVQTLDVALKYVFLRELAMDLASEAPDSKNPQQRIRAAVVSLRDAADVLGFTPTLFEYRELRAANAGLGLMADGTIRRALGDVSWADCLRRALLDVPSEGDFAIESRGIAFTEGDLVDAVRDYMLEHDDEVPTAWQLLGWTRLPKVQARPGRRPLSHQPFRRFGGYRALLHKAGLHAPERVDRQGRVLPFRWAYSEDELVSAVRTVAEALGRTPREADYRDEHTKSVEACRNAGSRHPLPAASTLTKRWGPWANVLAAAGLPPLEPTRRPREPLPRRPTYSVDEKLRWLREAWDVVGEPFSVDAYTSWRRKQLSEAAERGDYVRIPAADTLVRTFGGWPAAIRRALARDEFAGP